MSRQVVCSFNSHISEAASNTVSYPTNFRSGQTASQTHLKMQNSGALNKTSLGAKTSRAPFIQSNQLQNPTVSTKAAGYPHLPSKQPIPEEGSNLALTTANLLELQNGLPRRKIEDIITNTKMWKEEKTKNKR